MRTTSRISLIAIDFSDKILADFQSGILKSAYGVSHFTLDPYYLAIRHGIETQCEKLGIELTKEGAGGMLMSLMIDNNILIAYTLNNPKVIRMEPPLIMPTEVIDHVLAALRKAIQQINDVIEEL